MDNWSDDEEKDAQAFMEYIPTLGKPIVIDDSSDEEIPSSIVPNADKTDKKQVNESTSTHTGLKLPSVHVGSAMKRQSLATLGSSNSGKSVSSATGSPATPSSSSAIPSPSIPKSLRAPTPRSRLTMLATPRSRKSTTPLSTSSSSNAQIKTKSTHTTAGSAQKRSVSASSIARRARLQFEKQREQLASDFAKQLDDKVFGGMLAKSMKDENIEIVWSKSFATTAGRANLKRANPSTGKAYRAFIELSTKVVDSEEKLKNTLAHEMCHLACWMLDKVMQPQHGVAFKAWARKVMNEFPSVQVTTKHNYEIDYKFQWICTNNECEKIYGRHSKSIDPAVQVCGACRSRLLQIKPEVRQPNAFQQYMKDNMSKLKAANPTLTHKELMTKLATGYRELQEKKPTSTVTTITNDIKTMTIEDAIVVID
ncbi:HMG box protein [Schizosaccharomyces japonicus yFS275]|uniref:HMG box protein n=1 Tax=Schizosaccharomyces japonicus (strain yFS275 / FY16936) TaxID=402676 RepID=B6K1W0_SCHJY|nr:HMG box protein [Schizosaccharomyces japonicus yFS275]EEB07141.1 HMG box protein [Schizosaccharomyces japonicus yFS275]